MEERAADIQEVLILIDNTIQDPRRLNRLKRKVVAKLKACLNPAIHDCIGPTSSRESTVGAHAISISLPAPDEDLEQFKQAIEHLLSTEVSLPEFNNRIVQLGTRKIWHTA